MVETSLRLVAVREAMESDEEEEEEEGEEEEEEGADMRAVMEVKGLEKEWGRGGGLEVML